MRIVTSLALALATLLGTVAAEAAAPTLEQRPGR